MSTLIKLVITIFLIIFAYGFLRPLAISTYCHSHVGTGGGSNNVTINQALNAESSKTQQDHEIQACIDQTLPQYSIKPIDDFFRAISSPNSIPGITSPH
jgi:hypothetical protein